MFRLVFLLYLLLPTAFLIYEASALTEQLLSCCCIYATIGTV